MSRVSSGSAFGHQHVHALQIVVDDGASAKDARVHVRHRFRHALQEAMHPGRVRAGGTRPHQLLQRRPPRCIPETAGDVAASYASMRRMRGWVTSSSTWASLAMNTSSQKWAGSFSRAGYGCRANSTRASLDTPASTSNGSRFLMAGIFMVILYEMFFRSARISCSAAMRQSRMVCASGASRSWSRIFVFSATRQSRASVCKCSRSS